MSTTQKVRPGQLAELVAFSVAVGFIASLLYNWGYATALDLEIRTLPTTIADHFNTGTLWFPLLITMIALVVVCEFFIKKMERGLTPEEIIEGSKDPERTRRAWNRPVIFSRIMLALFPVTYLLMGDRQLTLLPISIGFILVLLLQWCTSAPRIQTRYTAENLAAVVYLPAAIAVAFLYGYKDAALAATTDAVAVTINEGVEKSETTIKLLRVFERGILYLDNDNEISFAPWPAIRVAKYGAKYQSFRGIPCDWFGLCAPGLQMLGNVPSGGSSRQSAPAGML